MLQPKIEFLVQIVAPESTCRRAEHSRNPGDSMACRPSLLSTTALSLLIASGSVAPSLAADMAVKARPLPPRPVLYSWTGFYIGAHVGAAGIDSSYTNTDFDLLPFG